MFDLAVLQAINDWQRGGDAKMKAEKGLRLKETSSKLEERFRTVTSDCFRRLALKKEYIWKYGDDLYLEETVSAWSLDLAVAKGFKGGVPPAGELGVILRITPSEGDVIVNLAALYADAEFRNACETYAAQIDGFEYGIGRYGDVQQEVVIKVDRVQMIHIYALGGYSSSDRDIAEVIFGREPDSIEVSVVRLELARKGKAFGPRWISDEAKDRILPKWISTVEVLRPLRR